MNSVLDFGSMSENIKKAFDIAKKAHASQLDKAGADYILHPMWIASNVGNDERCIIVALLHDVVEDTDVTLDELRKEFSTEVVEALDCMTHRKGEPYMDYVARVSTNGIARIVKLADLEHNMDLSRIANVTEKDRDRVQNKYVPAMNFLLRE